MVRILWVLLRHWCLRSSFDSTGSLGARSYPLSYVYTGYYYWGTGRLYDQAIAGRYWSPSIKNNIHGYYQSMNSINLVVANDTNKRCGLTLRCTVRLARKLWHITQSEPEALSISIRIK